MEPKAPQVTALRRPHVAKSHDQTPMKYAFAAIGFVGFAAVSSLHFTSGYRIAVFYAPNLRLIAAVAAGFVWLAFMALILWGMYHNRLRLPMAAVFCYGMMVAFAGMAVLKGVPSTIDEGQWRDPHHLLTPETKYLLHNHSVVTMVLSKQEYELYVAYGLAFFSGIGMVFCAAAALGPLDRTGQIFQKRRPKVGAPIP